MEPEAEDTGNIDYSVSWSGSEGSQELCFSESLADSYNEDDHDDDDPDASDAGSPLHPQSAPIPTSPERLESQECASAGEQQSRPEDSGSEEEVSDEEEDEICLSESRDFITESPHIQMSPKSPSPELLNSEAQPEEMSRRRSPSSSSSPGCAAEVTLALTLTTEEPLVACNRQSRGTGNRKAESSEEGGSSEAPPASVFFGMSAEVAEQAEKWNPESDTDLCRPDRHRAKNTRVGTNKSKAERQVKENKYKCKRIARLLTDAPNPRNKGALLFKKRRQRVKKYTLVSYGTGVNRLEREDQLEEETEEEAEYNFAATSESESEEEGSFFYQQLHLSLNWGSVGEMDALPETSGKGVLMFAQRRKRMDQIVAEHEHMRSKGKPLETLTEPEHADGRIINESRKMYVHTDQANYMDGNVKQHVESQAKIQQMNKQSDVSRPLVPNRTAKPFLGFQQNRTAPILPGSINPVTLRHKPRFKVPVLILTNPQVWSPTGEVIASRDERISVPAIKTGILPESKRKVTNKQPSALAKNPYLQNKGERKSYIESEEDCFSLGAEACNFMQARTVKLGKPPPVAPKPIIDPSCPPWQRRSPSGEVLLSPRSPSSQRSHSPADPQIQQYLQQQDRDQQMANHWNQAQAALRTPSKALALVNSSSQVPLQSTTNSWRQQLPRSAVSMLAHSPSSLSRGKPGSAPHSVSSCPPKVGKADVLASKASQASSKGQVSDRGSIQASDGPNMVGKGDGLFSKRQSRIEKFVVDAETMQSNKTRSPSPTSSLPHYWRYSSNARAPPPVSYNPVLVPSSPPSAARKPLSTSSQNKAKSLLFKYGAVPETTSPTPIPTPASKFDAVKCLKHRYAPSSKSTHNTSRPEAQRQAEVPAKSPVLVSFQSSSANQNTRSAELLAAEKHLDEKHTAAHHITRRQVPSTLPTGTSSHHSSMGDSIALAFSPASLIARGARQMAPRPKFSAKKPVGIGPQWKSVAMLH